jgi:Tfp pilus assembly protein PilX
MITTSRKNSGFALLITLITVSAVLAISLSLIELSLKQLDLAVDARDGEIAFQAANAGLECAQRTRRVASTTLEAGTATNFRCFNSSLSVNATSILGLTVANPGQGTVDRYQANMQWGSGANIRCSEIDMIIMVSNITAPTGVRITDLNTFHHSLAAAKTCPPGGRCTVAVSRGYNATCANKNAPGVIRREVLLEF